MLFRRCDVSDPRKKWSLNFRTIGSHHYGIVVVYSRRGRSRKWVSIDMNAYLSMKREAPSVFSRGVVHFTTNFLWIKQKLNQN